ncbi:aldehyde dehydrogenase family protein, partial [Novipirellula sp.]|uniref:aldehyde dehydrogenase family protein n=1 Tax=Novipirellula sp. TaxID=2795430 RepID=UPI003561E909
DLAVKHVVQSAFGHSGQKCSATSLLLLENDVFDDKAFREMLADAVSSIRVGSSWDLSTKMGPLIKPPQAELNQGLKSLEDDESWLVIPEHIVDNPNLYRPGVKWNIRPGSFTHLTELFGPVLGVMRFSRLEEAIEIVRSTGYGLTSGLESLDDREIALWRDSVHAGNLYINRPTTGAIVLRQPFGGVGLSAYGPGVKAGGPHYVLPLMRVTDGKPAVELPSHGRAKGGETFENEELDRLNSLLERAVNDAVVDDVAAARIQAAAATQRVALENEFSSEHDTFRLIGQDNIRRYRPTQAMNLRFDANDSISDIWISLSAAITVKTQVTLSIDPEVSDAIKDLLEMIADIFPGLVHPIDESESELVERISAGDVGRLRLVGSTKSKEIDDACAESFVTVIREPVLVEGSVECLRYLDEQSISHDYHRYGNPGRRAGEKRAEVL